MNYHEELDFSRDFVKKLRTVGDACQHHDKATPGIADLSFAMPGIGGWIELKLRDESDLSGRVLTGMTSQQQAFLERRGTLQTYCFLCIATDAGCYLFHWSQLRRVRDMEHDRASWLEARYTATWYRAWRQEPGEARHVDGAFSWPGLFRAIRGQLQ